MKMTQNEAFWTLLDKLVAENQLIIERPRGMRHPIFPDKVYPLDYGFLEGTRSTDNAGIDVWRGGTPGLGLVAVIVTVDHLKKDVEIKLLLDCSQEDIHLIQCFHNASSEMQGILLERMEKR